MRPKYDVTEVVRSLQGKVKFNDKIIEAKRGNIGLTILGKLDFLQNYCGYIVKYV